MQTTKTVLLVLFLLAAVVGLFLLLGTGGSPELDLTGGGESEAGPVRDEERDVAPADPSREEAGPGRGGVSGRVLLFRDRTPVPDVIVRLDGGPRGFEPRAEVTAGDGHFRFADVPSGRDYRVLVAHGEYAPVRRPGLVVAQGEESEVGTVFLERAVSLLVEVVDGAGDPVAEARVAIHPTDPPATSWTPGSWIEQMLHAADVPAPLRTATADAEGIARVPELPAGYYAISADARGYGRALQTRLLSPENQDEPVTIRIGRGFTLAGTVVGPDGEPVEGEVVASPAAARGGRRGVAALRHLAAIDGEGRYRFEGLAAGVWSLLVSRPGAPPWPGGSLTVPEIGEWDIDLGEGGGLAGTVSDEDGSPVADAEVRVLVYGGRGGGSFGTVARTDAEGRYAFGGLPVGNVSRFEVLREGFARYPAPGDRRPPIHLRKGEVTTLDVTLPTGIALSGALTRNPGAVVVSGAKVLAIPRGVRDGSGLETAVTDDGGLYSFPALAPGDYVLVVEAEDCCQPGMPNRWTVMRGRGNVDEQYVVEIEPGGGPVVKDLVVQEGAAVAGRVEDSDGDPVSGATVRLSNDPSGESLLTTADGTFRFTGVPSGEGIVVTAWTSGRWGRSDPVHVPTTGEVAGLVVRLGTPGTLAGTVELADGASPDGGTVSVAQGDVREQPWRIAQSRGLERTPVGPDGSFRLENVPPGTVTVIADVPGYPTGMSEPLNVPEGSTRTAVRIRIDAGRSLDGVTVDPDGQPVAGAEISVINLKMPVYDPAAANATLARSGPDGRFTVRGLDEGSYRVTARKEGLNPAMEPNVATGAATNLRLVLAPGGEVAGRVTDPAGQPLEGIRITVQSTAGRMMERPLVDVTDPDGSFRLSGAPDGALRLTASADSAGGANWITVVREGVTAGDTSLRIRLEEGFRISGLVREPDGSAANGVNVYASPLGGPAPGASRSVRTEADGSFDLAGLPAGNYRVQFQASGGWAPIVMSPVAAGTEALTVVLSTARTIEGSVFGPDGSPARGVRVNVQPMPGMSGSTSSAGTRQDGTFRIRNVAQGSYRLTFTAPGRFAMSVVDDVYSGATGVRVTMQEGLSIQGKLLTPDGEAAPRVQLAAVPAADEMGRVSASTDEEGNFALKGLVDARYRLEVARSSDGYILHPAPEVEAGAEGLTIRLVPGFDIAGRILDSNGRGVTNSWVSVMGRSSRWIRGDESGSFRVEGLPPGEYTLRIFAGGVGSKEVKARAGDTAVEVRIE